VGSIHGWIIEEGNLYFFLDSMGHDVGLQRNKTGLLENSELDMLIQMVFT